MFSKENRGTTFEALQRSGVDEWSEKGDGDSSPARTAASKSVVPELFLRLIDLIEDDPSRLDARHALDLLREAGLESEFDEVLRRANDMGLSVHAVAAIVLAGLLDGPLGRFLSNEVTDKVSSLQDFARRAREVLQEMDHRAEALMNVAGDSLAREVLDPKRAHALGESLQWLSMSREVLAHVEHCVRKSSEKLNVALASPPKISVSGKPSKLRRRYGV